MNLEGAVSEIWGGFCCCAGVRQERVFYTGSGSSNSEASVVWRVAENGKKGELGIGSASSGREKGKLLRLMFFLGFLLVAKELLM